MSWPEVSLILGILVIIVGGLTRIFGNKQKPSIEPKKFYDVEKQVNENTIEFKNFKEHIDEKIEELKDDYKESNKKIDKLTELLIDFVKNS